MKFIDSNMSLGAVVRAARRRVHEAPAKGHRAAAVYTRNDEQLTAS